MSYNVVAYQVDENKIASVFGSEDDAFLDRFLSKYKNEIEEQEDDFETQSYTAHLSKIINGELSDDQDNYIYGYLYEMLCQEFGELIEHDAFLSCLDEIIEDNHKAFIPLPENEDWPEFYSIPFQALALGRQTFLNAQAYANDANYIKVVNLIFDTALKNKKDLVFLGY